jgi:hypothetical protein
LFETTQRQGKQSEALTIHEDQIPLIHSTIAVSGHAVAVFHQNSPEYRRAVLAVRIYGVLPHRPAI